MWQRKPGQGRYAHPERERRFLLSAPPVELNDPRQIVDHYIDGTRLRLRQITGDDAPVYKLGQKVRLNEDDPSVVMLTNIYMSIEEYQRLATLPGAEIRKTRYCFNVGQNPYAVDVFDDRLAGLVLSEGELRDETLEELPELPGLVADVTTDDRFSGGTLAHTDKDTLRALLSSFGLTSADSRRSETVVVRRLGMIFGHVWGRFS